MSSSCYVEIQFESSHSNLKVICVVVIKLCNLIHIQPLLTNHSNR